SQTDKARIPEAIALARLHAIAKAVHNFGQTQDDGSR
ncbi:MAG: hypothetical protein QG667_1724, partial [Pseudomonadota bacterium]|nr:hypothetical protein [Pseudomonadota bacterium]